MGIVIFAGVLLGPVFCGFACPFGFIQDLIGHITVKLGVKRREIPQSLDRVLKYLRYLIFIVVGAYGFSVVYQILGYDPRANFLNILYRREIAPLALGIIVLFALLNIFYPRIFCRYFCYEGAKYSLFGIFKPIRISRNESKCVNCKLCDRKCPMGIKVSTTDTVDSFQCINCYQCTDVCPVDKCLESKFSIKNCVKVFKNKKNIVIAVIGALLIGLGILVSPEEITETDLSASQNQEVLLELAEVVQGKGIADGSYTGQAEGFKGIITTEVTVKDEKIISITVLSHNDDAKWYNWATVVIDTIIEKQTTDVDTVSGATFSSAGIINSVKDALNIDNPIQTSGKRRGHGH
jgi:polyferredoxin